MISWKIHTNLLKEHELKLCNRDYKLQELFSNLESELNRVKTKQDAYYDDINFVKVSNEFDLFLHDKYKIAKQYNASNVSNAWLKCYELLNHYNLIPMNKNKFIYFDNASFPGSFILATSHYIKTMTKIKNFEWYGSSWLDGSLNDKYNLYKNYIKQGNWLMNTEYSGDVAEIKDSLFWKNKFNNTVDLYTSDLGFEVTDYDKQEYEHVRPNLGQILTGLLILRKGGNMLTKQYTFFEIQNVTIYALLTNLFKTVYISKPITSRPANSETYVICKNFLGPFEKDSTGDKIINLMLDKIKKYDRKPFICKKYLDTGFKNSIKKSCNFYTARQIKALEERMNWYDSIKQYPRNKQRKQGRNIIERKRKKVVKTWYNNNPIKYLPNSMKLNVKEVMFRKNKN